MSGFGRYANGSVDGTALPLVPGRSVGKSVLIRNTSASNVLYVGYDQSVSSANGFPVNAGEALRFEAFTGIIWGVGSGTGTTYKFLTEG